MRHLGQVAEPPEPAHLVAGVGVDHGVYPLRRAQRDDRFLERFAFLLERGDRRVVAVQRLAVRAELDVGVGHGDPRFERRRVADVALGQLEPGHEGELLVLQRIGGPAEAEQRLVRLQALQAHPLEVAARQPRVAFGQRGEAERDVGAVAQAAELLVLGRHAADVVEDRHAAGDAARRAAQLEQGDAEVVAGIARAGGLQRHAVQHVGRFVEVAVRHQQVGLEQDPLFLQGLGQLVLDLRQCVLGFGQVAALVADLGEEEPGPVAHLGRGAVEQPGEDLARFLGQAVGEQHAAAQDLRFLVVVRDAAELLRGHQRRHRREEVVLEEVEQGVAVVRILDLVVRLRRVVGRGSADADERQRRGEGDPRQRVAKERRIAHRSAPAYCQSLTSNSGCSLPIESLMRSSMYLASVPFSNLTVAPRL